MQTGYSTRAGPWRCRPVASRDPSWSPLSSSYSAADSPSTQRVEADDVDRVAELLAGLGDVLAHGDVRVLHEGLLE